MVDLRKLAEAATPGRWEASTMMHPVKYMDGHAEQRRSVFVCDSDHDLVASHVVLRRVASDVPDADAAYIAAASPDVILALLDENERLRTALTALLTATEFPVFSIEKDGVSEPYGSVELARLEPLLAAAEQARAALNADG